MEQVVTEPEEAQEPEVEPVSASAPEARTQLIYNLSVENGQASYYVGEETVEDAKTAPAGTWIYLKADEPEGKVFPHWVVEQDPVELEHPELAHTTFVMPDEDAVPGTEYKPAGWRQNENGRWYVDENGRYVTGWQFINGYWYYFADDGYMHTGWQWINGYGYYFYDSGYMATDAWIGGSYVDGSGVWVK